MNEPLSQFAAVVSLLVRHSYFPDGLCRDLSFEPDADTVTLMRQHRLLLKAADAGVMLVAEQMPGLQLTENLPIRLHVFAGDPLFVSFTREAQELGTPLYFGATNVEASADDKLLPARAPDTVLRDMQAAYRVRRPVMIVDFVLTPQDFQSSTRSVYVPARSLAIELHTRALHWKYLFFGELTRYDLYIEHTDTENPVSFSACDEPLVNSGKALISHSPLPMTHEPQQRLQLKDRNTAGRVLIRRLPNASMRKIGKSRSPDGDSVYVAEIYINQ
ncbi:MAG: hypothetical protein SV422_02110 [Pseudomonadota bacterium]|nr:hypothetical protein [Pseudomonadota bacterium]